MDGDELIKTDEGPKSVWNIRCHAKDLTLQAFEGVGVCKRSGLTKIPLATVMEETGGQGTRHKALHGLRERQRGTEPRHMSWGPTEQELMRPRGLGLVWGRCGGGEKGRGEARMGADL